MIRTSVVIPTIGRYRVLQRCLRALCLQTRPPDEVVVVDCSDRKRPLRIECVRSSVLFSVIRSDVRSSCVQRNLGIAQSDGDVVFFLDDDCVPYRDYFERVLAIYQRDAKGLIGGVEGRLIDGKQKKSPLRLGGLAWLFRTPDFFPPSRMSVPISPPDWCNRIPVATMMGGAASLRRQVLEQERFDEHYKGYGFMEDYELSWRVSRRWALVKDDDAVVMHCPERYGRPDWASFRAKWILFRTYACVKNIDLSRSERRWIDRTNVLYLVQGLGRLVTLGLPLVESARLLDAYKGARDILAAASREEGTSAFVTWQEKLFGMV